MSESELADALGRVGLGPSVLTPSRTNGLRNMVEAMRRQARSLSRDLPVFPTLRISAEALVPVGSFAEAQAQVRRRRSVEFGVLVRWGCLRRRGRVGRRNIGVPRVSGCYGCSACCCCVQFLEPNTEMVDRVARVLEEKKIGVVAHFYMDPEVQGVLSSAAERWPHINISDSLVMADRRVGATLSQTRAVVCSLFATRPLSSLEPTWLATEQLAPPWAVPVTWLLCGPFSGRLPQGCQDV